jgi:suppressor of fused-like protein
MSSPSDEFDAPGWDAIDKAVRALYPGVEPIHRAPIPGPAFGGGVQGISAYPAAGHWHFVTYGLSELYAKGSENPEVSGFGYELTFRARRAGNEGPPGWAFNLLEQVARAARAGNDFWIGHRLDPGGPINGDPSHSRIALAFILDPELGTIDTPNGRLAFLQLVGITADELVEMKAKSTDAVISRLAAADPLLITDVLD